MSGNIISEKILADDISGDIISGDIINSGVTSFQPTDISNLELWLDATDSSTISLRDSTYVTGWNDKSGLGNDFTQTVEAEQPVLGTNEIDFTVSLVNLIAGSNYIFSASGGLSIVALLKSPAPIGVTAPFLFDFGLYPSAGYGLIYASDKGGVYTTGSIYIQAFTTTSSYQRLAGVYTFFSSIITYLDNVLLKTAGTGLPFLTASNIAESPAEVTGVSGPMTIGKSAALTSSNLQFAGYLKTLLIYTKPLTVTERFNLDTYLAAIS